MYCRGCAGMGWVDSKVIGPTICPLCKGKSPEPPPVQNSSYDQDSVWVELRKGTSDIFEKILDRECKKVDKFEGNNILVHLLFDRGIVPHGNIIFHHLKNATITGGKIPPLNKDEIDARNYSVSENGKVRTWEGIPVSPQVWGLIGLLSNKVLERELDKYEIDASRKGNPRFCDENMIAFSIVPKSKNLAVSTLEEISSLMKEKYATEVVNLSIHLLA